jgi:hypothetical protein
MSVDICTQFPWLCDQMESKPNKLLDNIYSSYQKATEDKETQTNPTPTPKDYINEITKLKRNPVVIRSTDLTGSELSAAQKIATKSSQLAREYYPNKIIYQPRMNPRVSENIVAISDPEMYLARHPEWVAIYRDQSGVNMIGNPDTGELKISFHGYDGKITDLKSIGKIAIGKDVSETSNMRYTDRLLRETIFKNGIEKPSFEFKGDTYTKFKFFGHSYGGYKARYFGSKYNTPAEIYNGHISPLSKFPEPVNGKPLTAEFEYHTIISDPVDIKYTGMLNRPNEIHNVYDPLEELPSGIEQHYVTAFGMGAREPSTYSGIKKYAITDPWGVAGSIAGIGLGLGAEIYGATKGERPENMAGLGNLNELGVLGFNIDPDYHPDENSATGWDWAAIQVAKPLVKPLSDLTGKTAQIEAQQAAIRRDNSTKPPTPLPTEQYIYIDKSHPTVHNGVTYYEQKNYNSQPPGSTVVEKQFANGNSYYEVSFPPSITPSP